MLRRLLLLVVAAAALAGATPAPASAYWVCVGVTPLDVAVCQADPMPGPPPLPGAPHDPEPIAIAT